MNQSPSHQQQEPGNGMERFLDEFTAECQTSPDLNRAAQEMRDSVFAAAQSSGVNPSLAFGIIFRDIMMLECLKKRVDAARASLSEGKLPDFIIRESRSQQQ